MTDQSSIFGTNSSQVTPDQNNAPSNGAPTGGSSAITDLLMQIKNDRGEQKYKTVEDALNGLKHAQEYIPQLNTTLKQREQELEEARQQAAKIQELESTLRKLTQPQDPVQATPVAGMTAEQVAVLVEQTLTKKQVETVSSQNIASVTQAVASKFGDKAEEVFYGKAQELGLSKAEFNALAAKTPKAVLSLLGISDTSVAPAQVKTSSQGTAINTAAIQPNVESLVGRNKSPVIVGATTQQLKEESARARAMVDELHSKGLTVHDLTDPKVFFKHFQ